MQVRDSLTLYFLISQSFIIGFEPKSCLAIKL